MSPHLTVGEPTSDYERILVYVLGADWQRLLTTAGMTADEAARADAREKVISLAREARPDLDDLELIQVAFAFNQWRRAHDPP